MRAVLAGLVTLGLLVAAPVPAAVSETDAVRAADYAPLNRPGPALRPARADLERAVQCSGDFRGGPRPVLLVPGTAFTLETQFSWSWAASLTRAGIPWCGVTPPENTLGDLTIAGEYDVYAIRKTYRLGGERRITVLGHSQGAMRPRWALRFWPGTRQMIRDLVSVAPDNEGVSGNAPNLLEPVIDGACVVARCPQGVWQQIAGSAFIMALNSRRETFSGIDYSVIYSRLDGLVQPRDTVLHATPGTSYKRVAVQDVCPLRVADHLTNGTVDAATWALIMDAIRHTGPVDPARVDRSVCLRPFLPGLSPSEALLGAARAPVQIALAVATTRRYAHEAALPCYVYAACDS